MNARWSPFIKQVAIVGLLLTGIWVLVRGRMLLTPLVLSLLLAYLLSFPVRWIVHHTGWPRTVVVAVTFLLTIVVAIVAPVLIVPRLVTLIGSLGSTLVQNRSATGRCDSRPISILPNLTVNLGEYYAPVSEGLRGVSSPMLPRWTGCRVFCFPLPPARPLSCAAL